MKLILIYILLFLPFFPYSQTFNFRHYTTDDGLPSSEVYDIEQDYQGYMWFATDFGACRFDGYEMKMYDKSDGLTNNAILNIYKDYKGRLWFVPYSGGISYYYEDSVFQYVHNDLLKGDLISNGYYYNFFVDANNDIYFIKPFYYYKVLYKKGIIDKKFSRKVHSFLELYNRKNKTEHPENTISPDLIEAITLKIKKAKCDVGSCPRILNFRNTTIYAHSPIILYLRKDSIISHYRMNHSFNNVYYYNELIWIAHSRGVQVFDPEKLNNNPKYKLLNDEFITNIYQDNEESLWFSTKENGVFYLSGSDILNYTEKDGLSKNKTYCIEQVDSDIWAGHFAPSLSCLSNGIVKQIQLMRNSNDRIEIFDLKYDIKSNCLFIGSIGQSFYKLYKPGENNKIVPYYKKYGHGIIDMEISDFGLVLGTRRGLELINVNNMISTENISERKLRINAVLPDNKKRIWLGTVSGLFLFKNDTFIYFGDNHPLLKNRIYDLINFRNENELFIATKGDGLLLLADDTVRQFTTDDGLSGNSITSLFLDGNKLLAGTNNGLNILEITNKEDFTFKNMIINKNKGLLSNEITEVLADSQYIYLATFHGLSIINKKNNLLNRSHPPVYIKKIRINEHDTTVFNAYTLPHYKDQISIGFVGLSYKNAGNVLYKYRLTGRNRKEQWTQTRINEVKYSFLQPDKYTFEVYAINEDGYQSLQPARVNFTINPPFWNTWWFYSLISLTVILIIWIIYYNRLQTIRKRNKLKQQLNQYMQQALTQQMNPHFIFNSLNSIQNLIFQQDIKNTNKFLSKFSQLMRKILYNSHQNIITLEEELDALSLYLELEKLRFKGKLDYSLTVDDEMDLAGIKVPALLIQPYIENAIIHGIMNKDTNGRVDVSFVQEKANHREILKCIIEDNGVGRQKAMEIRQQTKKDHKSLGTKITQERIDLINSLYGENMQAVYTDLSDDEERPAGTRVEITLPDIK